MSEKSERCRYCGGAGKFQIVSPVSDGAWASCFCSRDAASQNMGTVIDPMSFAPEELAILDRALDRIGWDEIHAYHAELRKGQDIYEDGGGFFLRAIKALFGVRKADPVTTYQTAAREMIALATTPARNTSQIGEG